jgi:group I intron endonuclease
MSEKPVFVYLITCSVTGKKYVGITVRPVDKRWSLHKRHALRGGGGKFMDAIRKYGPDAFVVEQLETAPSWEIACERERALIAEYGTFKRGYNSTIGGEGLVGYVPTPEALAKRSVALKGIPRTPEWKAKIGAANKGKKPVDTPKKRAAISRAHKGKKRPPEWKEKIRCRISQWWEERRAANPENFPPKPPRKLPERTPEHREKLRQASLRHYEKMRNSASLQRSV